MKTIATHPAKEAISMHADSDIERILAHELRIDPEVPAERIKFSVWDGYVTFEGDVDWAHQRDAAETCARRVVGVRGITNRIQVGPRVGSSRESW